MYSIDRETDELRHFDSSKSQHIVVCSRGWFFKLKVFRRQEKSSHMELLTSYEIQQQLIAIQRETKRLGQATSEDGATIPVLTSMDRIKWAETRQAFFSDGTNKATLSVIESAIFVVVMEEEHGHTETLTKMGKALLHGDGANRWFDKSITLVSFPNGNCGLNVEHSWADAPVIAHLWEYVLGTEKLDETFADHGYIPAPSVTSEVLAKSPSKYDTHRLQWNLKPYATLRETLSDALVESEKQRNDLDLRVLRHNAYGKGFMKKVKMSPDAYIQMALQLAYYKNSGTFTQTYEASMTRLYKEGRTETVRTVSKDSVAFVLTITDDKASKSQKIAALRAACDTHQQKYRDAMSAKGVDRHLFTLYCVSIGLNLESPFLKHALSIPWKLSTSQQPQQQTFMWAEVSKLMKKKQIDMSDVQSPGGGFGPVAKDGYGVSYMITGEECVYFHISSIVSEHSTSSELFAQQLEESFRDMKELFDD